MDNSEQVKFLVDFANADLAKIREGDLINLQDDFERFFAISDEQRKTPGIIHYNPTKTGKRYAKDKLEAIQTELRVLLSNSLLPTLREINIKKYPKPQKLTVEQIIIPGRITTYAGEHRDLFFLKLGALSANLERPELRAKIRQCEPCGKFFFRVRRQKHCSPQCADKANYLKRQKEAEQKESQQKR